MDCITELAKIDTAEVFRGGFGELFFVGNERIHSVPRPNASSRKRANFNSGCKSSIILSRRMSMLRAGGSFTGGLKPDDLKKRMQQIDEEEHPQSKRGFQTAGAADLHDMLQQAMMNDPKQAQRDDWQQQQVKALNDINGKIVAPPPGQPNPWQFVA
jgi:hypothetical protein